MTLWTPQQEAVFAALPQGSSHSVNAVAGSGKTSTIVEGLRRAASPALCVAFNKRIAEELTKRLSGSAASAATMNSLGHRAWAKAIGKRLTLNTNKLYALACEHYSGEAFSDVLGLARAARVSGLVPERFAIRGLLPDSLESWESIADYFDLDFNAEIYSAARKILDEAIKQGYASTIDFDDQIYLSALFSGRFEKVPLVVVDEAQDLSPLQHRMLQKIVGERICIVGDPRQCHPPGTAVYVTGYGWRSIESLKIGECVATFNQHKTYAPGRLTQGRRIEHIQESQFDGELVVATADSHSVLVTPNHKVLTKFGSKTGVVLYAMLRGKQCRLGICDLHYTSSNSSGLASRARQEKADAAWILQIYNSRQEALVFESAYAALFGVPDLTWECSGAASKNPQDLAAAWEIIGNNEARLTPLLQHFGRMREFPIWQKNEAKHLGVNKSFITQACNLISGMCLAKWRDDGRPEWRTVTVSRRKYTGPVYGLQVEPNEHGDRLYWANAFCVHNSIYGFRGASANSMAELGELFNASELPLSVSFRCPKAVVAEARAIVPWIESAPSAPEGEVQFVDHLSLSDIPPRAHIVCRYNGPIFKLAWALIKSGRPATILGADIGQGLIKLIKKLAPESLDMASFLNRLRSWAAAEIERKPHREAIIRDREISLISISEAVHTSQELCDLINKLFSPGGTISLSSIHKAKGLEWDTVIFYLPQLLPSRYATTPWQLEQEENLRYVAITRTKRRLIYAEEIV